MKRLLALLLLSPTLFAQPLFAQSKGKAGDVVIQQATNHAWINRGTQPCRILFVLMDSKQP